MSEITDLIRDIEAAAGPDRHIDAKIAVICGFIFRPGGHDFPHYTGSIDSARQAIGSVSEWHLSRNRVWDAHRCHIDPGLNRPPANGYGATEPLAMCAAAMRLKEGER